MVILTKQTALLPAPPAINTFPDRSGGVLPTLCCRSASENKPLDRLPNPQVFSPVFSQKRLQSSNIPQPSSAAPISKKEFLKAAVEASGYGMSSLLLGATTHASPKTTTALTALQKAGIAGFLPWTPKALFRGRLALGGLAVATLLKPAFKHVLLQRQASETRKPTEAENMSFSFLKKVAPFHLMTSANLLLTGVLLGLIKALPHGKFPVPKAPHATIPLPTDFTLYGRLAVGMLAMQQFKKAFHWQPPPWISSILTVGTMTLLLSGISSKSLKLFAKMAPFVALTTVASNMMVNKIAPWLQEHKGIGQSWTRWGISLLTLALGTTAYMKAYEPFLRTIGLKAPALLVLRGLKTHRKTLNKLGMANASKTFRNWIYNHKATIKRMNISNALEGTEVMGTAAMMGELKFCPNGCTPQLAGLPPFCLTQTAELMGGKTAGLPVANTSSDAHKEKTHAG